MKKSTLILTVVSVALGTLALCFGIGYFVNYTSSTNTLNTVNGMYERSFYELVDNVNNMEVNLSKLRVADGYTMQQKLLTTIIEDSISAQNNLSTLPISDNSLVNTTKFVNQVNGYCTSLINYNSTRLSTNNFDDLDSIYDSIATIKYELNNMIRNINNGYRIVDNLKSKDQNLSAGLSQITNDSIEFPTLIYDGPFSDSLLNKEPKALGETTCSAEEAKQYLDDKFSQLGLKDIMYSRECNGKIPTYDFNVTLNNGVKYYAQVTKQGKMLISLSSVATSGSGDFDEEQCKQKAEDFVKSMGLDNMSVVWQASSNGIAYLNLTTIKNNIIIYPEMIKVKINLSTGDVIGYDATTYVYNHDVNRSIGSVAVGVTEAREVVGSKINITSNRLCVIPQDYGEDRLAYEFSGDYSGHTYYVYVDAMTGDIINIMRIIQTDEGELIL